MFRNVRELTAEHIQLHISDPRREAHSHSLQSKDETITSAVWSTSRLSTSAVTFHALPVTFLRFRWVDQICLVIMGFMGLLLHSLIASCLLFRSRAVFSHV